MDTPVQPRGAGADVAGADVAGADVDTDTDISLLTDNYQHLRLTVSSLARTATAAEDRGHASSATPAGGILPAPVYVDAALAALPRPGQPDYLQPRGARSTLAHIVDTVVPALNGQNYGSGRYFGFVTGGTLPVAEAADNVVSALDQNVCLHLPHETVATEVEAAALQMLADVLQLPGSSSEGDAGWSGRLFTTGATASNILGLALGREGVLRWRLQEKRRRHLTAQGKEDGDDADDDCSVASLGIMEACRRAGVRDVRVLTSMAHSSLYKAASVVGLGRRAVVDLPYSAAEPWRLDLDAVERELAAGFSDGDDAVLHIVSVSAGEVNTGRFATTGRADMERLRALADQYGAWIHVDGAMGLYARALPDTPEFARLRSFADGLELADSITTDGHKLLNVPYDTGIFFSRHLDLQKEVFQNANAAYLGSPSAAPSAAAATPEIPSPGNHGLENSRRFRALPVYAVLLSEGRQGVAEMLVRMVHLAREIRRWITASTAYACFDQDAATGEADTHIGVLFWATDDALNRSLAAHINATGNMYVSATVWQGRPAVRIAVSSWRVDVEQDLAVVVATLAAVAGR